MPLRSQLLQKIQQAAADPVFGIRADPRLLRDRIRLLKTDCRDLLRQPVRIVLHDIVQSVPVFLVDLVCQSLRDAELLQKEHRAALLPLCRQLIGDLPCLLCGNPLDLRQPLRLLLDDAERIVPELLNDTHRHFLTKPLDRTGAQITDHRYPVRGCYRTDRRKLKLRTVRMMFHILPVHLHALAGTVLPGCPDTGFPPVVRNHAQDLIAGLLTLPRDLIDIAFDRFHVLSFLQIRVC